MLYGSEIFHTASQKSLKKLDKLQYAALRICCGAIVGTPLIALQQETGQLPLTIERNKILYKHAIKITSNLHNPAKDCFKDAWQNYYTKHTPRHTSTHILTQDIRHIIEAEKDLPVLTPSPPWEFPAIDVDISLSKTIKKAEDNPTKIRQLTSELMDNYNDYTQIYTDGSKTEGNYVGSAVYIPHTETKLTATLPQTTTIYTAELIAINTALQYLIDNSETYQNKNFALYSDSLSVLKTLSFHITNYSTSQIYVTYLLMKHLKATGVNVVMIWVPSHIGIIGNDTVDILAKQATNTQRITMDILPSLKDCYDKIEKYIIDKWQQAYDNTTQAKFYKRVEPKVNRKVKYQDKNRKREVQITRIRLGFLYINTTKNKYKHINDNKCQYCNTPETLTHFLFNCPHYNLLNEYKNDNFNKTLNDSKITNTIYQKLQQYNKWI